MHRSNFHGEAELLGAFLTRFQGGESMSRILPLVAGIVSLGLLVSACGGDSESGSENPSASSPSSASTTPGETGATPSEPEIVEVVPEPVVLTADDLVTGMPTNKQMSMVQGFRFVENDDWVGEDDEGPEWANNAPLTKEQRSMLGLGQVRRVMPEQCMLVSMGAGNGLSQELSNQDAITAAAYSYRANDYRYFKNNLVWAWQTVAYVLPPGQSTIWVDNISNLFMKCRKYTAIKKNGDIERVNLTENYPAGKTMYTSGQAYVMKYDSRQDRTILRMFEAIGDVIYFTKLTVFSSDKDTLARAAKAYNVLADNIAEVAQVTREPVDFNNLVPFTPDPEAYIAPEIPLSSGARA